MALYIRHVARLYNGYTMVIAGGGTAPRRYTVVNAVYINAVYRYAISPRRARGWFISVTSYGQYGTAAVTTRYVNIAARHTLV